MKQKSSTEPNTNTSKTPVNFFKRYWQRIALFAALIVVAAGITWFSIARTSGVADSAITSLGDAEYSVELSGNLQITNPGTYQLSGEISDGVVTIKSKGEVRLILNNVSIKNSKGPAIFIQDAESVTIITASGSENYLEDSSSYSGYDEDEVGVIFSHDDLFLDGEGTLTIKANNQDGIVSKDDLKIIAGNYNIASADDAIRGKDSITIESGKFVIASTGAGIKSTNTTDEEKGDITINGGTFTLTCADDGLHSSRDVNINNGEFTISSDDDGIHADSSVTINSGKITITKSYEGIEGETVNINDGEISLVASDDGINAAGGNDSSGMGRPGFGADQFHSNSNSAIYIRGGKIVVNASGDGIDSNGNIYVEGGETIVYGPTSSADGALDYDGEMVMTGGTLLAGGASGMAQGIGSNSTVYSVNIFANVSAGAKVSIVNSDGQEIATYTSEKSFSSLVVASPKLVKDQTYTIKVADETYQTFTVSAISTQVGNGGGMGNGNMPGGAMPNDIQRPMSGGMRR